MKIGVLSDIHGNHLALNSVLQEAAESGVQRLLVLGDVVGYYYHPDKVMALLNDWPMDVIQGNHEGMLRTLMEDGQDAEIIRKKYGHGLDYALNQLSTNKARDLIDMPARKTCVFDNNKIELCHGSPWDRDAYVYPDAPPDRINRCFVEGADFVFMGHTHYQFAFTKNGATIANPGSVGQNRAAGGIASWGILDTVQKRFSLRATPYDVAPLITEAQKTDPGLPYLSQVLE